MLADNGSADHSLHDMLVTHGAVYLADLEPILLLQEPLHSFFINKAGFDSSHTETARMAQLGWLTLHLCNRLERGEFELPSLPRATASSA